MSLKLYNKLNMTYHNKNLGKSPFDPDYLDGYNPKKDKDAFDEACEERERRKRED